MEQKFDVLIAGAGYAGAVAARPLADRGKRALVLERRPHVGGNAYDRLDGAGVLIVPPPGGGGYPRRARRLPDLPRPLRNQSAIPASHFLPVKASDS